MDEQDDRTQIDPRANPWAMLASLPLFSGLPKEIIDAAVAELEWITLPGDSLLFEAGEPADSVYFVVSGCLGAFSAGGKLVGRIAAGESVGEMGLIVARPRAATVRALRDSDLARLSSGTFERVLLSHPAAILRLARLSVERLLENAPARSSAPAAPRTITVIPYDSTIDVAGLAANLVKALTQLGRVDLVGSTRAGGHSSQWFHEVESRNNFVVYVAGPGDTAWNQLCVRQADVLVLAARARDEAGPWSCLNRDAHARQRAELLLLHEGAIVNGASARWRPTLPGAPCHHLRGPADMPRIVRLMTHRAVGLVLSGGGARGFAHLGVVRALRENGVPIDMIGGSSMGGILAAGVAADWTNEELFERFRRSFVETNPLSDFTWPLVSLVSGRKVGQLLRRELGDIDIEDLPLPFFCVSSNLTSGRVAVHQQGPLWRWLRASVAIPGVLPPVFHGGEVFVDGGTMNNLPVDVMRAMNRGPVIGVDVATDPTFTSDIDATEAPPLWNLFRRQRGRRKRPNILQILWRSGMVNSTTSRQENRGQCDLLLMPPLESLDLLDWKSFARAIEIGYRHACERLDAGGLDLLNPPHP
ncbi:MAG: patatin-like phospholipase family protein [Gammaproteobacteria bacterium]|nr:patatin-like phospholipase family protein [Gammaproteobacteria bacterium]